MIRVRTLVAVLMAIVLAASLWAGAQSEAPAGSKATSEPPLRIRGMANMYTQIPEKAGAFWATMEKEFNVDYTVDWVPADASYDQKQDLMLASGDLPDVMQVKLITRPSALRAIAAGAFWDITDELGDFSKYPNFKKYTTPEAWTLSKVKGRNYIVPRTRGHIENAMWIRGDWLDKLGLKAPATVEEFAAAVTAMARADLDGNGRVDTVGLVPMASYFSAGFGTKEPYRNAEGGIVYASLTPGYADYVEYMRKLFAAGAVAKEFPLINTQLKQEELFITHRMATLHRQPWHKYRVEVELAKLQPGARITLLPYLKGPAGNAHFYDIGYAGGMVISKKVDEPKMKRILAFFDATANEKYYNFVNYGIEGVHWMLKDGAPVLTEQGKKEVTASFNAPFIFSTAEFAKVDSPLAPMAYNLKTREEAKPLYAVGKIDMFQVIQSGTFAVAWSKVSAEFDSMEAKAISGAITMDEFRAFQKKLVETPDFKTAFKEFAQSHKDFFGN